MAEINLTQAEANALIAMEKHRACEDRTDFPMSGQSVTLHLQSANKREQFLLDLSRSGRIDLKVKMQNRGRQVVALVRLDLGGSPHRNPDGEEVSGSHLHVYREDHGDAWAVPVPADAFRNVRDLSVTLEDFLRFCNITRPPHIDWRLFT